jgi:hypothetical protein
MNLGLRTTLMIIIAGPLVAACSSDNSSNNGGAGAGGGPAGSPTATASLAALAASAGSAGSGGSAGAGAAAGPVTGTATFSTVSTGVTVAVSITGCVSGKSYPIHIHQGTSCADTMSQGAHWDVPRGEGIPMVVCSGTTGMLAMPYTRLSSDAKPWSIGDGSASDMVGHVVVLHDPDVPATRISCGAIVKH